jgi:hypothetical protein
MGLAHSSKRAHIVKELERYARALNQTNTLTQSFWQQRQLLSLGAIVAAISVPCTVLC